MSEDWMVPNRKPLPKPVPSEYLVMDRWTDRRAPPIDHSAIANAERAKKEQQR